MVDGERAWRLEVLAGGDTLRQERLTRALHDELAKADGAAVGFLEAGPATGDGHKGGVAGDVALWGSIAAAARPASQVLIALVTEWCAKERNRKVEMTYRGNSVTISGRPDEMQEQMIRDFLGTVREDEGNNGENEAE
ncbi:hypothetical protein C8250_012315 [Streptomyces sp. So13.3]|uniref:hypothetical protein n=1 Tax=Streptomyces TaxID=1883 RepID=UPI00110576D8|nr:MULTISPECIES: hypothetical protein [Streptomyces]MCZ4096676.1 hypothetical protein [Streptomyces sp. H39-C1]QNA72589.1 hypothetical protein C8250_012315 [Streptomyces sp. So13.3]